MANLPTVIQTTYALEVDASLLRRVREKVKEFDTPKFVVISDITYNVGDKDDFKDSLVDQVDSLNDQKEQFIEDMDKVILDFEEQIADIDAL